MNISFIGGPCAGKNIQVKDRNSLLPVCVFPKGIMYVVQTIPSLKAKNKEGEHYILMGEKYVHSSISIGSIN
jgi:hypothetical protein